MNHLYGYPVVMLMFIDGKMVDVTAALEFKDNHTAAALSYDRLLELIGEAEMQ